MSLQELLEKVSGNVRDRREAKADSWANLVARVADGKEKNADQLADQIETFGKSAEDLAADVDRLIKRRDAAEFIRKAGSIPAQKEAQHARLMAAEAELKAANEKALQAYHEKLAPLQAEERRLSQLELDVAQARGILEQTWNDQDALAEIAALQEQIRKLRLSTIVPGDLARKADLEKAGLLDQAHALGSIHHRSSDKERAELLSRVAEREQFASTQRELHGAALAEVMRLERRIEDLKSKALIP